MRKNLSWIALIFSCLALLIAPLMIVLSVSSSYGDDQKIHNNAVYDAVFNYVIEIRNNSLEYSFVEKGIIFGRKKSDYMIFFAQSIEESKNSENLILTNAVFYSSPETSHPTIKKDYTDLIDMITIEKSRYEIKINKIKPFTIKQFSEKGATIIK